MAALELYASVTGCGTVLSINVNTSHSAQSATVVAEVESTTLNINNLVTVNLGYTTNHRKLFTGYVKNIEEKEAEHTYVLTISDVLVRAMDFFIASSTPDTPFTRQNITAEKLVEDVLALAGITSYNYDATSFTFAIGTPLEVNLTSSYDYCRFIADVIAWHLYADENGTVNFINRKPYVDGDSSVADVYMTDVLDYRYSKTDKNLRNRVVVYGASGVHAEASASSPYLPAGFYRTAVVAAPQIFDSQSMAQKSADYNLDLYNRLTESCNLTLIGNPDILARDTITFHDTVLGETGDWYVFACEHVLSKDGYFTNVELRR